MTLKTLMEAKKIKFSKIDSNKNYDSKIFIKISNEDEFEVVKLAMKKHWGREAYGVDSWTYEPSFKYLDYDNGMTAQRLRPGGKAVAFSDVDFEL